MCIINRTINHSINLFLFLTTFTFWIVIRKCFFVKLLNNWRTLVIFLMTTTINKFCERWNSDKSFFLANVGGKGTILWTRKKETRILIFVNLVKNSPVFIKKGSCFHWNTKTKLTMPSKMQLKYTEGDDPVSFYQKCLFLGLIFQRELKRWSTQKSARTKSSMNQQKFWGQISLNTINSLLFWPGSL